MTPAEIAAMVDDADDWFRVNGNHPVRGDELAKHVRALAAELTAHKGALHEESLESDQWQLRCNALESQLEAVTRERDEWRASHKLLEHKIITCGVAASHPDASLSHRGAYAEKWDSQQAQEVRKLRAERDRYKAALENINRISGPNVARDVVREALKGAGQ